MFPCPHCQTSVEDPADACPHCSQSLVFLERFRLTQLLGEGGMGRVYEARDGDEVVAVKALALDDPKAIELFERGARTLSSLDHPALPTVYGVERPEASDRVFLIRERLDGNTLEERITQHHARLERDELRTLLVRHLELLDHLHTRIPPVVHRDIKPSNIMFRDPESWDPVLVDFDTVAAPRGGHTLVGTPGYAAPEQLGGDAQPASDLYGLGATLLFVATHTDAAELPRPKGRFEIDDDLEKLLGPELTRVLRKLLEPTLEARYASAAEALADLGLTPERDDEEHVPETDEQGSSMLDPSPETVPESESVPKSESVPETDEQGSPERDERGSSMLEPSPESDERGSSMLDPSPETEPAPAPGDLRVPLPAPLTGTIDITLPPSDPAGFRWAMISSLSGLIAAGGFLLIHLSVNLRAALGDGDFSTLESSPLVIGSEVLFVYLPLLFHAGYGMRASARIELPRTERPGRWWGVLMPTTGVVILLWIAIHVVTTRLGAFHADAAQAFDAARHVQSHTYSALMAEHFAKPSRMVFYLAGALATIAHLGFGTFTFAVRWGYARTRKGRQRAAAIAFGLAFVLLILTLATLIRFVG